MMKNRQVVCKINGIKCVYMTNKDVFLIILVFDNFITSKTVKGFFLKGGAKDNKSQITPINMVVAQNLRCSSSAQNFLRTNRKFQLN